MDLFSQENNLNNYSIYDFLEKNNLSINTNFIVDRFEENFAVCENKDNGNFINIPRNFISSTVKPGNIIKLENNLYIPDNEAYQSEVQEIKELAASVFKRKK